ncbi:hypothetical protein PLA107_032760 (plasmid) [Pseudomonas amygdali pv. lachrymans str. M301315]|uniref:Uncharacterized protein n=3 Tax=Pseudomonas amygdali TaxID=47877 RepID=A0ABR5KRJ2_PSEAV|nr:hypothetical protein PLA107_032760 [Pseudomonas amygdali pv. lachrymans str. M301315]KPC17403.1 Unknown protein sequence [Pseudomonas amygdali pv. lachrymans]
MGASWWQRDRLDEQPFQMAIDPFWLSRYVWVKSLLTHAPFQWNTEAKEILMHLDQHLNFPLTKIFVDRAQLMSHGVDTTPYAKAVNQWLEEDSELCQKVRSCLGVGGYHVKHMRDDIECKYLTSLMSSFMCRSEVWPSRDHSVLRFDRLANLYERVSHRERLQLDRLFKCMLGSLSLPDLLSTPVVAPTTDLSNLAQQTVDVGFGDESEIFCEYENQWVPAHLLPYRFTVYRSVQVFVSEDDPTPEFVNHLEVHGHCLDTVLAEAVKIVLSDSASKDSIRVEYYGNDILLAWNLKGTLEWIHPEADTDECPAYWRNEYPFDVKDLMKKLMTFENKNGSYRVQENLFGADLGL